MCVNVLRCWAAEENCCVRSWRRMASPWRWPPKCIRRIGGGGMSKLFLVGLGPGSREQMTLQALEALEASDVLVGYTVYIDLVKEWFPDKETYTTPMTQELERCRWALEAARQGKTVSMLCSGDAGVYGMAGPVLELSAEFPEVEIVVVPGATAALSGAAVLGAPLMHDFCVISLSDLLTPWATIEKRLRCAGEGDFSCLLYTSRCV